MYLMQLNMFKFKIKCQILDLSSNQIIISEKLVAPRKGFLYFGNTFKVQSVFFGVINENLTQ